jgi:RNA 2',3'-cyclic 3'-phosphodiesterase
MTRRARDDEAARAFVALEIDAAARARVAELMAKLRPLAPGARWVAVENLHLTLRFLGPSRPEALERIASDLDRATAACPPSTAPMRELGMFPERGSPRVLWLDIALPEPILGLQEASERAAVAAGFERESRPFRSHLTLARFRDAERPGPLPRHELGEAQLERVTLFRSELRPQGPVYTALRVFPLGRG